MWLIYNDEWMKENNCHIVSTIHDEVLVECPEEIYMECGKRIRELMIKAADVLSTKLPIKCDVELFREAWYKDGETLKLA